MFKSINLHHTRKYAGISCLIMLKKITDIYLNVKCINGLYSTVELPSFDVNLNTGIITTVLYKGQ